MTWKPKCGDGAINLEPWARQISKAENYMPHFPIMSGVLCALASLFTSVQHCLEILVYYLVTLSYKPVQQSQTHNTGLHCISVGKLFYNDMRFTLRVKAWTPPHHLAHNSQSWLSAWWFREHRFIQWNKKTHILMYLKFTFCLFTDAGHYSFEDARACVEFMKAKMKQSI